ncbi:hypothetical protein FRX31_020844 [Thalictrum thalictroides]|uniref:Transmembrane protein n=1 Tax=Thalictrum thalictroides TaxID=46969 RepID=A0A7J6VZF6_THATH|nr:hypothetical protein FRX31_020844 [Thalictrum thalictroides]
MKEASKLLIGASLAMVISLGVVLAALLVLLAELYCSILLRKRRLRANTTTTDATTTVATDTVSFQSERCPSIPYNSIYAHGVLQAPRSLLFPTVITKEEEALNMKQHIQQSKSQHFHEIRMEEPNSSQHCVGIMSASSPSSSYVPVFPPQPTQEVTIEGRKSNGGGGAEHLVYISNPMYDNEVCSPTRLATPFETPDTSPSRLGISGSSSEDDDDNHEASVSSPLSLPMTPPLTPMKKLPAQASSISLRDARSLGTSVSGSDSVNGPSSSSSGSPRTSPSC